MGQHFFQTFMPKQDRYNALPRHPSHSKPALFAIICFLCWLAFRGDVLPFRVNRRQASTISWFPCSSSDPRIECTHISVPLDHKEYPSDERNLTIALTRYKASDQYSRQGSIFVNPGGPGVSGTNFIHESGSLLSSIVQGKYDIIGFDPRGVNQSTPYVSCFPSRLDEVAWSFETSRIPGMNLPLTLIRNGTWGSDELAMVQADFERQFLLMSVQTQSLARKCQQRTGESLAYMGTEAVVRDVNLMSLVLEGDKAPINYWGFSSGTIIGQYMVQMLPPHRLGKIVLDSVSNVPGSDYPHRSAMAGLIDIDKVLSAFASSCVLAGPERCELAKSFKSAEEILSAIDELLDNLYYQPRPLFHNSFPGVVTAADLRRLLWNCVFLIRFWPEAAQTLHGALLHDDFSGVIKYSRAQIRNEFAGQNDTSTMAMHIIDCIDYKPYTLHYPPPTHEELAKIVFEDIQRFSPRVADRFAMFTLCNDWTTHAGLDPRKSRFGGPFTLPDDTLDTPILLLSNTLDPVTPLSQAKDTLERLGNNARLVQQVGGFGHYTINHWSDCTARRVQEYFVHGQILDEDVSFCEVTEQPFAAFDGPFRGTTQA